jgi:hypothetical protein
LVAYLWDALFQSSQKDSKPSSKDRVSRKEGITVNFAKRLYLRGQRWSLMYLETTWGRGK